MQTKLLTLFALFVSIVNAHFVLNWPNSLGFSDDDEDKSPCGGEDIKFDDNDMDSVQVDGFAVAVKTTHPAAQFLYRGTLNQSAPFTWTNLMSVVAETGINEFCLPAVKVPSDWAGKKGLIQVIQSGPDGMLYQCAAVNFAEGKNSTVGSNCKNSTGVSASLLPQSSFSSMASATSSGLAARATGEAGALLAGLGFLAAGVAAL